MTEGEYVGRVGAGQSVAGVVSPEDIRVEIHVDEACAELLLGMSVSVYTEDK